MIWVHAHTKEAIRLGNYSDQAKAEFGAGEFYHRVNKGAGVDETSCEMELEGGTASMWVCGAVWVCERV